MKKVLKDKGGFTLVELVVVIAIIAVLMALAIVTINTVRRQSRNAQLRNDAQTAKIALEASFAANRTYPNVTATSADSDFYDTGTTRTALATYVSGTYPPNPTPSIGTPADNTGTVCFRRMSATTYRLWVQEEGVGGVCTDALYGTAGAGNRFDVE